MYLGNSEPPIFRLATWLTLRPLPDFQILDFVVRNFLTAVIFAANSLDRARRTSSFWVKSTAYSCKEAALKLPSVFRCLFFKTVTILPKLPDCCHPLPKLQKVSWFDSKVIASVNNKNKSMWQIRMIFIILKILDDFDLWWKSERRIFHWGT